MAGWRTIFSRVGSIATNKKANPYWVGWPGSIGAGEMNRTPDLLITNELLYRLSYTGNVGAIVATRPLNGGRGLLVVADRTLDLVA